MATWKIEPTWKKSVVEKQYWTKGGNTIIQEIGWRWGEFIIETEDDSPPDLDMNGNFDILDCGYECADWSSDDSCWEETDFDMSEEDEAKVQVFLEENSIFDLEEDGWEMSEFQLYITCPITIEKVIA